MSPPAAEVLLEVRNLKTQFKLRQGIVRSVDGVDLTIFRGQTLGVVGESGCGKSVTAQSILRIVPHPGQIVGGQILLHGKQGGEPVDLATLPPKGQRIRDVRGGEIGMIFQEPMASLSPVYSIGNPDHRDGAAASRRRPGGGAGGGARHARPGRLLGAGTNLRLLPAPVERRHAAAGGNRHGAGRAPQPADRRRAHHRPGRDHRGARFCAC